MKKISLLAVLCFLTLNLYAAKPYYQGQVTEVHHGGSYSYLQIKEKTEKTFWIVVSAQDVKKGDVVRFQKELVAENFESKALNRKFDKIMFAGNLQHKISK